MPPKKNKNQTKVLKKTVNATKGKNKKNSPSKNARKPPPKKSAKIKGNSFKKNKQTSAYDKSMELNITVVWNKNDESSNECPKSVAVKNKNKPSTSNKKLESKDNVKQSMKEDVKVPGKIKVAQVTGTQVRNLRKRSNSKSAAENQKAKKCLKSHEKETQVTPSMIDKVLSELNSQQSSSGQESDMIIKNKKINKHKSDESGILIMTKTHNSESNKVEENNQDQTASKTFNGEKIPKLDNVIVISSDEEN